MSQTEIINTVTLSVVTSIITSALYNGILICIKLIRLYKDEKRQNKEYIENLGFTDTDYLVVIHPHADYIGSKEDDCND